MHLSHLIVGPAEHGVTEYARLLAENTGGVVAGPGDPLVDGPVHVTFTDHLFGDSPDAAVDAVLSTVGDRPLSVSFHDVPQPGEGAARFARRAPAYRRLARAADVAVTNSRHEATFFGDGEGVGVGVGVIPLPLPEAPDPRVAVGPGTVEPGTVGILGFIYPGKGHREIVDAAGGLRVRALGGHSPGHEELDLGDLEVTGYLDDRELWEQMARIHVPVCAHRHVSASGSLMRWLSAGRRVLVADGTYAREVSETFPEQIRLVDDWPAALASAAADPSFAEPVGAVASWGWPEVATAWQSRWATAAAFAPWFRGNRRPDLAAPERGTVPVSVVIPYYNDPASLTQVIRGLEADDYPGPVEVIVADDGSTRPPEIDSVLPVRVLTQPDRGFRAAAARNLGARAARHPVIVFLDADTVPEPGYLAAVSRWVAADPRCVVVGTRLQADGEPSWLADAWAATDDLALADGTGWRYVISSVLTLSKELFDEVGGFDATMVGYGGEDWELGFRLWNHGAVLLHEPAARARHLEPDWGARDGDIADKTAEKNHESVALAHRITHPIARGHDTGVVYAGQDIVVTLPPYTPEPVVAAWLRAGDVRVVAPSPALFSADPRVGPGAGRVTVTVFEPVDPPEDLPGLIARIEALGGWATVCSVGRPVGVIRVARVSTTTASVVHARLPAHPRPDRLERWFAGW